MDCRSFAFAVNAFAKFMASAGDMRTESAPAAATAARSKGRQLKAWPAARSARPSPPEARDVSSDI